MANVTISRISHFDKDKNGAPLTSKTGKPYTRCLIDLVDGRKVSGFGNAKTQGWSAGMEVDIEITESNGYLNFSVPKESAGGFTEHDRENIRAIRENLHTYGFNIAKILQLLEGKKSTAPAYPEPTGEVNFDQPVDF